MNKKFLSIILLAGAFITGCDKNQIAPSSIPSEGTRVKFIHAIPGAPALDLLINNTKITPMLSSPVTDGGVSKSILTGVAIQTTFPSNDYAVLNAGSVATKVMASTPFPLLTSAQTLGAGVSVFSSTLNLEDSKYYSLFSTGFPDAVSPLLIEDKFPDKVEGKAFVRLVHVSPNGPAVDVQATYTPPGGTSTIIVPITNVTYKNSSAFVPVDVPSNGNTFVFQMRNAGLATTLGGVTSSLTLLPGRYYTLFVRGLATDYAVPNTGIVLKASSRPAATPTLPEIYYNPIGLSFYTNK